MGIVWVVLSLSVGWAQSPAVPACADPVVLVGQAKSALLEARLEDAAERIQDVEVALGCSALVAPALLSELWLIEGVRLYFAKDPSGASRAFAASERLYPLPWPPEYGEDLKVFYDEAIAAERGEGRLILYEAPPEISAALDGTPATFPTMVLEGPHLVQIFSEDDAPLAAHLVMLPPGETTEIRVGPLEPRPTLAPTGPKRRPVFLVGGSVSAVLAGGAYALARGQDDGMASAGGLGALDEAYGRQKLLAGTAYGLAGLSAVGFGLYFAL